MPTPRTRRRTTSTAEPSVDRTPTKVNIPEGTKAQIREQIGGKEVIYEAEVEEVEEPEQGTLEDDTDEGEDSDSSFEIEVEERPLTPIERLFYMIELARESHGLPDTQFIAHLTREADHLTDTFSSMCHEDVELGTMRFNTQDRFAFTGALQRMNNNSGGRFIVNILQVDGRQLTYLRQNPRRTWESNEQQVWSRLLIPEPNKLIAEQVANNGNSTSEIAQAMLKMAEMNQQNHNQLMQALNRQPEKSTLEKAIEQKMLNDLLNPPERKEQEGFNINKFTEQVMMQGAVVNGIGEAFNAMIHREPAAPPEPTAMDIIERVSNMPVAQNLLNGLINIGGMIAEKKGLIAPETVDTTASQVQNLEDDNADMKELLTTIIDELESDRVLDSSNITIQELRVDFPDQIEQLQTMCQIAPFEGVFKLLVERSAKIEPFPFADFLDVEQTQATNSYVWNERGAKLIARLQEFYEYIKQ